MFEPSTARIPAQPTGALPLASGDPAGLPDAAVLDTIRGLVTDIWHKQAELARHLLIAHERGLAAAEGSRSTTAWLAAACRVDPGEAAGLLTAARVAAVLPQLGAAFDAGQVGPAHLRAVGYASTGVPADVLALHDQILTDAAHALDPRDIRRLAQKIQSDHDADAFARNADHHHDQRFVRLSPALNGTYHLEGRLDPEQGAVLSQALAPLLIPTGRTDERKPEQRRADALIDLAQRALDAGDLPESGGDRPRITLTVTAEDWTAGTGLACLADRHLIPISAAQRFGCDAAINLAGFTPGGEVLYYGHSQRDPALPLRRAVILRDGGCVFPDCDRPAVWCQVHHLCWWCDDGPTDIDNLALLCSFHHHQIHAGHWTLTRQPPDTPGQGILWTAVSRLGKTLKRQRPPGRLVI
jgi:hypothetical protein